MESALDTIFEEREELMISPTGDGVPNSRTAHFLKPSSTSTKEPASELPSLPLSSRFGFSGHQIAVEVKFKGRRNPPKNWSEWARSLGSRYEPTWKKVGIFEAIMNSTYHMLRDNDLIVEIAKNWCPETNTFIFPWGEATITLEDMMVLGGYPVVGDLGFSPVENKEMLVVLNNLNEAHREVGKANPCTHPTTYAWMEYFMGTGQELEHEAFLSLWLSRFVFPSVRYDFIEKKLFPIAIRLARGIPVAPGPAVLASLYKDLSELKQEMVKFVGDKDKYRCLLLELWAPFQLVQLWVWERFPTLRPKPNLISQGEPRAARWHKVAKIKVGNVREALDSAGECFLWRPYASGVSNCHLPKFYREQEEWVLVGSDLDKELKSFARILRVSELVGQNCTEQYLPHRVAMQFGMDQDLPCCLSPSNKNRDVAWSNYNRPIVDKRLYIPARLFESDVTLRYFEWWRESMLAKKDEVMSIVKKPRSIRVKSSGQERKMTTDSIKEVESPLLKVLRSLDRKDNIGSNVVSGGSSVSSIQSESKLSSTTSNGERKPRYKSLEEIAQGEASMGAVKGADDNSPKTGLYTISSKNHIVEHSDNGMMKKPKLEQEDEIGEVDKLIAQLKAEFANRLDRSLKITNADEIEKTIAELKEEFGSQI